MEPIQLLDLSQEELQTLLADWGEPRYRAGQIQGWLYQRYAASPEEMTDLPKPLRARLAVETSFNPLTPLVTLDSSDGQTRKTLFGLPAGESGLGAGAQVEAVLMGYKKRRTLCISTQAGCAMGCPFCATGQGGFARNLTAGEIVAQVLYYARVLARQGQRVTNVVFMGMGEPLANYAATWAAIRRLNAPSGFGLGARAMTLSTVGLVPAMRRVIHEPEQVGLAVSLHAPVDALRDELVPVNRKYPLSELIAACNRYLEKAPRDFITFEYVMLEGVNDTEAHAREAAALARRVRCKYNLIPFNPFAGSGYKRSSAERIRRFAEILQRAGVTVTTRKTRGDDIAAACGQLAGDVADRTRRSARRVPIKEVHA